MLGLPLGSLIGVWGVKRYAQSLLLHDENETWRAGQEDRTMGPRRLRGREQVRTAQREL